METVNGLSKTGILGAKAKMKADPDMAKDAKVTVKASWNKGVIKGVDGRLVCHPPPEIAKIVGYPSMNSYCPLISAACFSIIFMIKAAEEDHQFETFETDMRADADFSCFYKPDKSEVAPWGKKGVYLDIRMTGRPTQMEIDELGEHAENHCPSVEIMRREFPVFVTLKNTQVDIDEAEFPICYDMDKFRAISESEEKHIVKQHAQGKWYCYNENKEHPDSMMAFECLHDGRSKVPLSNDKPVHNGIYANPVQACFFGGLSTHMHTVAMLLYSKGYNIKSMEGQLTTVMNKRIPMGADKERKGYIFPKGTDLLITIESNAPDDVVEQIQMEAEGRSPALMNWLNTIRMKMRLLKEDWETSSAEGSVSEGSLFSNESGESDLFDDPDESTSNHNVTASSTPNPDDQATTSYLKGWGNFLQRYKRSRERIKRKQRRLKKKAQEGGSEK